MNGIQLNGKPRRSDKPVPGCLGRMVNFFDLTSSGNHRLLTDKPHNNDGSSLSRSLSDVSRICGVPQKQMQDKVMISELRRSSSREKPGGTPVKMLMAQEMSNDLKSRQNSPNVVARLMGLDALPRQQPNLAIHTQNINSEKQIGNWKEEHVCYNNHIDCEIHSNRVKSGNILESRRPSQRTSGIKNEFVNEKVALIRQKLMEAKRFATDENFRQTREFQDALDVLNSKGDLFLEVLQEPNSFSKNLYGGQSIPSSPETKRITVLRPSKVMVDEKFAGPARTNDEHGRKQVQVNLWGTHNEFSPTLSTWKGDDSPPRPTRIVVLKPSALKINDIKTVISSTPSSPRTLPGEIFYEETEDEEEAREAREVAKEITQQMRENLAGLQRDETLLLSFHSNGYTGDESSFDKSYNEFEPRNFSDPEVTSAPSRLGSPYSLSSFTRASYSPESSVCREAKKRLSERWAMMESNGSNLEPRHFRKSSSTLGEMLAIVDMNKCEILEEKGDDIEQNRRGSTSCISSDVGLKGGNDSPGNLLRSKSVPVSSSYGESLNVETSKTSKSSFAGKVTGLFFPSKKTRKDKSGKPRYKVDALLSTEETPGTSNNHSEMGSSPLPQPQSSVVMDDVIDKRIGHEINCDQDGYCVSHPTTLGIQGENQDQPSPISVLEPPFEEDESSTPGCSSSIEPNPYGYRMPPCIGKSSLIDKSPPIGSIARTLSWEESCVSTTTSYPSNSLSASPSFEDDDGEMLSLVQSLLSMAGLDDVEQLTTNMTEWHSPGSPLDPLLKDKYIDLSAKEPLPESRRRQLRSRRKLIIDCVNAALVDISGVGITSSEWTRGRVGFGTHMRVVDDGPMALSETVWVRMKELYEGEVKFLSLDDGDSHSLVERVVIEEVVGKGWAQQTGFEVDIIGEEIEGKLLEQLVEEYLVDWTR